MEADLKENGWVDLNIPLLERVIWEHFGLKQVSSKK